MRTLTEREAYAAMYYYLEKQWKSRQIDARGSMLGDMSLLPDGSPADRAVTADWKEAVQFALGGGSAGNLGLSRRGG